MLPMGKSLSNFVSLASLIICLCACSDSNVGAQLSDIESYIEVRPDSALTVLENFDRSHLRKHRDVAKFSLLYATALDKNYIDTADLNIIKPAVDYYSKHGTADEKLKSYYYQGVVYRNAGDLNNEAISSYMAEKYAYLATEKRYVGLLYSMIADIYSSVYNHSKSIEYTAKAKKFYLEAGDTTNSNICLYDLACAEVAQSNYDQADTLLKCAMNKMSADTLMMDMILSEYAKLKVFEGPCYSTEAISMLDTKRDQYLCDWTMEDYYVYACAKASDGDSVACYNVLGAMEGFDANDKGQKNYWLYRISKQLGRVDDAIEYLERTVKAQDQSLYEALSATVTSTLKDYQETEMQIERHHFRVQKLSMMIITLFVLLLGALLSFGFFLYRREKRLQIDKLINIADDIQVAYSSNFKENINLIGDLNQIILDMEKHKGAEQLILMKLRNLVPNFKDNKADRKKLEDQINVHFDNIVADLRRDFPDLKEKDILFYCFQVLGFSVSSISAILEISVSNVYVKRNRLREKLSKLDDVETMKYVGLM